MRELFDQLQSGFSTTSMLEWIAVLAGIGYIFFAVIERPVAWPLGIISSALYIKLNIDFKYYTDAILQLYYCGIGCYGWLLWSRSSRNHSEIITIRRTSKKQWIALISIGSVGSTILGFLSDYFTDSPRPWMDATLTAFSFIATWMTARKLYENWLIWIIVDLAYIVLYWLRPSPFTAILFLIYTLVAVLGLFRWRKQIHLSNVLH